MTEFGRTIKQNGGNGTEHGYGTAIFMAGGLLKKSQVHTDWPGLKRKELYDGRDLNATIDARSVYASAMSTVFDLDFKRIQKDVFWGENYRIYLIYKISQTTKKLTLKRKLDEKILISYFILIFSTTSYAKKNKQYLGLSA